MGFLKQDFWSGAARLLRELLARIYAHEDKLSYWQLILLQSKANGCSYHDGELPQFNWQWPKHTWFQDQLSHHLGDTELAARRLNSLDISANEPHLAGQPRRLVRAPVRWYSVAPPEIFQSSLR